MTISLTLVFWIGTVYSYSLSIIPYFITIYNMNSPGYSTKRRKKHIDLSNCAIWSTEPNMVVVCLNKYLYISMIRLRSPNLYIYMII